MHKEYQESNKKVMVTSSDQSQSYRARVKKVGNYIVGKMLGSGSFGEVRVGTHVVTGEKVALKILDKAKISTTSDLNMVVHEIQVLKLINHKNLVRLYEVFESPKSIYMALEYCKRGELYEYLIQKIKLQESEAFCYFHQIIAGMQYLHVRNICHRDLKLENLLLCSNPTDSGASVPISLKNCMTIKIADFGMSKILANEAESLKTSCGSPYYAAPELLSKVKYSGQRVDIWCAGIILYAMVCGVLPFDGKNNNELFANITTGEYSIPNHVSPGLADLLRKMIVADPEKRITLRNIIRSPWYIENAMRLHGIEFTWVLTDEIIKAELFLEKVVIPSRNELIELIAHKTTVMDTIVDSYLKEFEMNIPPKIDFAIVHGIITTIPNWSPRKIITALKEYKHNQYTATYFLLSEAKTKNKGKILDFEEQRRFAELCGYELRKDGTIADLALKEGNDSSHDRVDAKNLQPVVSECVSKDLVECIESSLPATKNQ